MAAIKQWLDEPYLILADWHIKEIENAYIRGFNDSVEGKTRKY